MGTTTRMKYVEKHRSGDPTNGGVGTLLMVELGPYKWWSWDLTGVGTLLMVELGPY